MRGYDVPWKTGEINQMMEQRDYLKQKAAKTKDRDMYEEYKRMKNKVNKEMKKSQKEYYTGLILENMSRPDKLWKAIKQVMPSASKTEHTTTLSDEDGTYKKPTEVADCFNRFFSTIGSKLAASFSEQPLPQNPYGEHQHQFKFISHMKIHLKCSPVLTPKRPQVLIMCMLGFYAMQLLLWLVL